MSISIKGVTKYGKQRKSIYRPNAGESGLVAKRWSLAGFPVTNSNVVTLQIQGIDPDDDSKVVTIQASNTYSDDDDDWETVYFPNGKRFTISALANVCKKIKMQLKCFQNSRFQ